MHPARERLLARLDGELQNAEAARIALHLQECADCQAQSAELERSNRTVAAALATIDAGEPAAWSQAATLPLEPRRRARFGAPWRWAAVLVLGSAAAAAGLIVILPQLERRTSEAEPAPAPPAVQPQTERSVGLAVEPLRGTVTIVLTRVAAATHIEIAFDAVSDAAVDVSGSMAPRFEAAPGRLNVDLQGSAARLLVTFPRHLAAGTISVDGDIAVRIVDGRIAQLTQAGGVTVSEVDTREP